tara:strand:+ start:207 stop:926 length:720 start_codon:yes stop_codon:yes gene_type:complete
MWWYSYWRFLGAQLTAPPAETTFTQLDERGVALAYRGRRGIGVLLLGLGFTGALAFLLSAVALMAMALGAPLDEAARFQATVICGICFPFFLLALRGVDELLRHRAIVVENGVLSVTQGGLFVRTSGWSLPADLILGVGLYSMPHVGVTVGGTTQIGAYWHVVDLVLRHRRRGPLVVFVSRDAEAAKAMRAQLCAALDRSGLDPPGGRRGPTLRYLITSIALALAPTTLSLLAMALKDG